LAISYSSARVFWLLPAARLRVATVVLRLRGALAIVFLAVELLAVVPLAIEPRVLAAVVPRVPDARVVAVRVLAVRAVVRPVVRLLAVRAADVRAVEAFGALPALRRAVWVCCVVAMTLVYRTMSRDVSKVVIADAQCPLWSVNAICVTSAQGLWPLGPSDCHDAAVTMRRVAQLFLACVVLGVGVGLLLLAALGSDGYSTMINGISIATALPFVAVNCVVGVVLVVMAWARGTRPGLGTIVQPVVVGFTISALHALVEAPAGIPARLALMVAALPVLAVGVAGYLGSGTGAGPTEAAALAFDPPVPFRWSYSILQGGGALLGWLLGAAVGPGTILVIFLLGPAVDLLARRISAFDPRPDRPLARSHVDERI